METPIAENILNVTLLEPRQKHPTIFAHFDELPEGETLVIHNDHDPKPLYYQLLGERGNTFIWEYVEQGPEWWKVKITRRVSGEPEETLGQIAAKDLRKAEVFRKYGLDFCCGGKKSVKEACAEKGLDVERIERELESVDKVPLVAQQNFNEWKLDFLAEYIENVHHGYVRKQLPEIRGYAAKVLGVHGAQHPELARIRELVEEVNEELTSHMIKEEKVLFPYIKSLWAKANQQPAAAAPPFGSVQAPINMMEMEHELVGENMEEIRQLTNHYALPADACASYALLYKMLEDFERDLHLHIHLENNILFPKAIELEKQQLQ
jgi:regulator of cell morphogenesis and NO signaling